MSLKPIIELKNVNKYYRFGKVQALKNVSLKINEGDFVSIIGTSGSGKSTLMNLIGCLDIPTSGEIFLDGEDITKMYEDELAKIRGRRIGFVFQTFNLYPTLTVKENVELPLRIHEMRTENKAMEILQKVGMGHRIRHFPSQLSGGERQRVAIARALATNPEMILADEPTGNLDTKTGNSIMKILENLNKKGITIVIVTHDDDIAKKTKRIVEIIDGEIKKSRGDLKWKKYY